jgi:hypothetical protein
VSPSGFGRNKKSLPQKLLESYNQQFERNNNKMQEAGRDGFINDSKLIQDPFLSNIGKAKYYDYLYRPKQDKMMKSNRQK